MNHAVYRFDVYSFTLGSVYILTQTCQKAAPCVPNRYHKSVKLNVCAQRHTEITYRNIQLNVNQWVMQT